MTFAVIEADCPWKFGDALPGNGRGATKHYACMTTRELCAFPLPPLADSACLLLWRVASMQQDALDVMRAWGFTLKTEIVWEKTTITGKPHFGMGHYVRASHETCLLGIRGRWKPKSRSIRSRFSAPVGRHSAKPDAFYDLVEQLADGPYVRLFARAERPGWTSFGNELEAA